MTVTVPPPKAVPRARPSSSRTRSRGRLWIAVGLAILLLPIGLTFVRDAQLSETAGRYAEGIEQISPDSRLAAYLDEARDYNRRLAEQGHHAAAPVEGAAGLDDYLGTLDAPEAHGVMARIRIPSIEVDLPIGHTTRPDTLRHGAGHMFGSDLPVGGAGTTSVISAHTGMVDASMFDRVIVLEDGADIFIDVYGETLRYQVTGRQVVGPADTSAIRYAPGEDRLVLITCTPYGINTDRLLVDAIRVPLGEGPAPTGWRPVLSWWMALDLAIVAAVIAGLLIERRRAKRRRAVAAASASGAEQSGPAGR